MANEPTTNLSEDEKARKIDSLREMISSAEKTIQGAKAMLLQLEGKKKVGRRRKFDDEEEVDGRVVHGTFDGQIMIGTDGKQYPVPANYASKSKLVEGDMLKLVITPEGQFVYKQIGPIDRKSIIGIVSRDDVGNYYIVAEGRPYKVLLASVTYYKIQPGDEVVVLVPANQDATWAALENILQSSKSAPPTVEKEKMRKDPLRDLKEEISSPKPQDEELTKTKDDPGIIDEWTPDLDSIEKEIREAESNE